MKQKDLVYYVLAFCAFVILGLFLFSRLSAKNGTQGVTQVEVVDPISSDFNQQALTMLSDRSQVVDYTPLIPLTSLGSNRPFGPLR